MLDLEIAAEDRVLFRSPDLLVRKLGGFSARCCIVTFASYTEDRTLDRPGFGEAFLQGRGIDAVHVISRDNDWYQYPEIGDAMACVREATRGYGRVVTYGSSMGAYAAIRLAGLAGAGCALALSPQYSIDPARVPFETRWAGAAQRFRPVWEGSLPFPELDEAYVVYDPLDQDARHAALIAAEFRFAPVPLRNAGHPVAAFLLQTGLLQALPVMVSQGPLPVAQVRREAWANRRRSVDYFLTLADRTRHPRWRIGLLERAVRLQDDHAYARARLGLALGRVGRVEEALAMHRSALEIEPGQPNLVMHLAVTLQECGDLPGALAVVEELWEATGRAPAFEAKLNELRGLVQAARDAAEEGEQAAAEPEATPVHSAIGVVREGADGRTVTTAPGEAGCALFGPYAELQPGPHQVEFRMRLDPPRRRGFRDRRICCVVDACTEGGQLVLARRGLSIAEVRAAGPVTLAFDAPVEGAYEFRVFTTGVAGLTVEEHRPCRPHR